jgi:hypothetical protein
MKSAPHVRNDAFPASSRPAIVVGRVWGGVRFTITLAMLALFASCSPSGPSNGFALGLDGQGDGLQASGNSSNGNHESGDTHCERYSTVGEPMTRDERMSLGNVCSLRYPWALCQGEFCFARIFNVITSSGRTNDAGLHVFSAPGNAGYIFLDQDCNYIFDDRCPNRTGITFYPPPTGMEEGRL